MPSAADRIKHMVVLMLENRSFDHVFGFLKSATYPINGLNGDETNPGADGQPVRVSRDARYGGDLWPDPGHDYLDTTEQVFGNKSAIPGLAPPMSGFVKNYFNHTRNAKKARRIMKCFDPAKLPVLTTLAREFAICDNWFSSIPGPTIPNRAYMHFGTSLGRLDMSPNYGGNFKTIYEVLDKDKKSPEIGSKIYFHDSTMALTISYLLKDQKRFFGEYNDFLKACKKGTLPAYCLVEPMFASDDDFAANDQHPDHDVAEGEILIRDIYNALRNNKQLWESTMFVITYDEHGGCYDHVEPPAAVNPDGIVSTLPPFKFDRLGVRVPAVVISPYIERGTIIHDVFDHTSLISTARKLFTKNFATNYLTERDRLANTLDVCLNRATPRPDRVQFPKQKSTLAATPKPKLRTRKPPTEFQLSLLQQALALESTLPLKLQSDKPLRAFTTEREAAVFLREMKKKFLSGAAKESGDKAGSKRRSTK